MERCATCRYWQTDAAVVQRECGWNARNLLTPLRDASLYDVGKNEDPVVGACTSPKLLAFSRPSEGEASVIDGSEYQATLVTTGSFGCTNHVVA